MPLVSSPRGGEGRGSGMRGRGQRYAESVPPHLPLWGIFSPAGRRKKPHALFLSSGIIGRDCRHVDDVAVFCVEADDLHGLVEADQQRSDHR